MKFYTLLTICLISLTSCKTKNAQSMETSSETAEAGKTVVEKISLSEKTRGTNRLFTITPTKVETDINGNMTNKSISSESWKIISDKIAQINLKKIESYKSPTTKRYSDAALASVITIETDGKTYNSSDFDSGNPPQQLADLYHEIKNTVGNKKGEK